MCARLVVVGDRDLLLSLRWRDDLEALPGRWSTMRNYAIYGKRSHRDAGVQEVKGYADCEGNLWADRAARLSLHTARWHEEDAVRREKFDNFAAKFRLWVKFTRQLWPNKNHRPQLHCLPSSTIFKVSQWSPSCSSDVGTSWPSCSQDVTTCSQSFPDTREVSPSVP